MKINLTVAANKISFIWRLWVWNPHLSNAGFSTNLPNTRDVSMKFLCIAWVTVSVWLRGGEAEDGGQAGDIMSCRPRFSAYTKKKKKKLTEAGGRRGSCDAFVCWGTWTPHLLFYLQTNQRGSVDMSWLRLIWTDWSFSPAEQETAAHQGEEGNKALKSLTTAKTAEYKVQMTQHTEAQTIILKCSLSSFYDDLHCQCQMQMFSRGREMKSRGDFRILKI